MRYPEGRNEAPALLNKLVGVSTAGSSRLKYKRSGQLYLT